MNPRYCESTENYSARNFYETEVLSGGWSVRQLERQINSQFYERTLLSKNKSGIIAKKVSFSSQDKISPENEIKDPYVLELLDLKDEYSESDCGLDLEVYVNYTGLF